MTWFAVDDRFHSHRKVLRLRRSDAYEPALALWLLAGTWAAGDPQATHSGVVPIDVLATLGCPRWPDGLDALVAVGLWESDGESVGFHDWQMWNGSDARHNRSAEQTRLRQVRRRMRLCDEGRHSKDCPTVDADGNPWRCPKRANNDARYAASRDAGTGRDGPGRDGKGSPTWGEVPDELRTPETFR